ILGNGNTLNLIGAPGIVFGNNNATDLSSNGSIIIGNSNTHSIAPQSITLGNSNRVQDAFNIVMGNGNDLSAANGNCFANGNNNLVTGNFLTVVGSGNTSSASNPSLIMGNSCETHAGGAMAFGSTVVVNSQSLGFGAGITISSDSCISVGASNTIATSSPSCAVF